MRIQIGYYALQIAFLLIFLGVNRSNARATNRSRQNRLPIESNSIQHQLVHSDVYGNSKALKRVFLSNRTVTCNDGSMAGFYLRKSQGSRRWVVFFEGGWHCYDTKSCRTRWLKLRQLMTSAQWPDTRNIGGILSPNPFENPYWFNANHVFVPYCSSDSWSGTRVKPETRDGLRFMGSLIVRQVIADLIPLGLGHSQGADLLMAGSSAGGLGVMLNLDKVRDFLQVEKRLNVNVRGVSDSGWFLDREPYTPGAVAASEAVRQGWKLWDGSLPEKCVEEHIEEPWRCYFGHRLYRTLVSPLFVFQWLFDEAQMQADSVGAPVTTQQWDYVHEMGAALRASLDNVTAVFAPSCIGHSVLTKRDWLDIKIDDISLAEALRCWEKATISQRQTGRKLTKEERVARRLERQQADRKRKRKLARRKRQRETCREQRRKLRQKLKGRGRLENTTSVSDPLQINRSLNVNRRVTNRNLPKLVEYDQPELEHNQQNQNNQQNRNKRFNCTQQINHHRHERNNQRKRLNSHSNRHKHHTIDTARTDSSSKSFREGGKKNVISPDIPEPKKCALRLLERCSWPQCNNSCPMLTNPLTGEEMKFLELLASFGLDMEAVATALGVDMHTLNNMEQAELVNLLTQQAS